MSRGLLCVLLWCCATSVFASRLDRPYVVEIPVASQSADERTKASVQGLQQLLLKLTGKLVDENALIQQRLASGVDKYLLQFSYEKGALSGGYAPASPFVLRLSFSQTAVLQLLHDAALPLWPLDRPQLLLLMLDAQGNWIPAAGQDAQSSQLRQWGSHYGVPVVTPVRDTQDMTDITVQAVQSADISALQASIVRYQADALLAGVISGDDTAGWQGQWTLQYRDARIPLQKQAATLPALFDALFRELNAQLSGQYQNNVRQDTGATTVHLQVEAIDSYSEYTLLRDYLEKLDAVKRLEVVQLEGSTVSMDIEVTGEESFRSLLGLCRQLAAQEITDPAATADVAAAATSANVKPLVWRYRWIQ